MRKGSIHVVIMLVLALAVISGLTYYALSAKRGECVSGEAGCAASPTPTPSSATTKGAPAAVETVTGDSRHVEAAEFVFDIPKSWTLENSASYTIYYDYLYSNQDSGDFIHLTSQINPVVARGADVSWVTTAGNNTPHGLTLSPENNDCRLEDSNPYCMAGDNKLMINVAVNGLPAQYRPVFIEIGNSKSESVNRQAYRDILKTLKIRSGFEL